ncbi:TPA: Ig-like domain-containing protein [Yersinia enterocolitica]|uniref:Ig-like domain-containing protein n=1 Tax=Yersinia enterocolitica TaxID=630 RepID=UPI001C8D08E5|nr:invasin domain 3-containing protein [Yersinia enterocolitica]MBX9488596.1 Ig-like domain-containing protein [Yersinia enterocolitica]MBX9492345.1 Ig-like domain-containing protein [Yersinia enterocolitica]HEN3636220.1 Ig-like domain-containing protein [Yersinia enterocolitica]
MRVLIDTKSATLTWRLNGTELTPAQLSAPFGDNFLGQTLTLDVSAPVTVSSSSGKPTTAEPQIISAFYTLIVPSPGIALDDFTADSGANIAATDSTGVDGSVMVTLTNTRAGITKVTASVNGSRQTVDNTFIADVHTANISGADFIVASGAVADGVDSNALSATVKDAYGNPLPNIDVTFTVADGAATPARQTVKTNGSGLAQAALMSTVAGDNRVTVTSLGSTPAEKVSTFISGSVSASSSTLTVSPTSIVANGTATSTLSFTARDVNNNPLTGRTIAFAISGTGATRSKVGTVTGSSNGVYTATPTAGVVNVAVAVDGTTVSGTNNSKTVTLTAARQLPFSSISVNGYAFKVTEGFPTTGFIGASFNLNVPGVTSDYNWSSNVPWATVDKSGKVTLSGTGNSSAVTIKATPKAAGGASFVYNFMLNKMYAFTNSLQVYNSNEVGCIIQGYTVPHYNELSNNSSARGIGPVWQEWGI